MNYFAYPSMLGWLVVALVLAASGGWLTLRRRKVLALLGQLSTVLRLLPAGLARRRSVTSALRNLGLFFVGIALAGPLIGSKLVEYKQRGLDIFIAVDCSMSMLAEDLKPNRMAHAKLALGQLIDRLGGSRIGILAFAGQAYTQCPLTVDENAAKDVLEQIDVGTVPIPGTAIGDAIRLAIKGLKAGEGQNRVLVLLTDGEDHKSDPDGAAKDAAKVGVKIYSIGIGSQEGEPIPILDDQGHRTGYKRDKKGEVVMSRVDEALLDRVSRETQGQYFRASPAGDEAEALAQALERLQQGDQKTRLFNRFENRYQWPLALGLILLLISLAIPEMGLTSSPTGVSGGSMDPRQRRPGMTALALILISGMAATSWSSESQLREGNRQFKNGHYEAAQKLYEDALIDTPYSSVLHFNLGDAALMKGDAVKAETAFMEAAQAANPVLKGASHYNRGNALFYQGKWADAVEAYKESLRANPQDEDAKYNLGVALKALKNPPPPKSGQPKPDPKQSSGKEKDKDQKSQTGPQPKPGQMSKEDAERLLSAAGSGEKKKSNQKAPKGEGMHPDEDW